MQTPANQGTIINYDLQPLNMMYWLYFVTIKLNYDLLFFKMCHVVDCKILPGPNAISC